MKWDLLNKSSAVSRKSLINILLKNRGIKTEKAKKEFINPIDPMKIKLSQLGIAEKDLDEVVNRIDQARSNKEFVIIYGDYDADGITASAVAWETLHDAGVDVFPFVPDRFEDGYGIKAKSVLSLKSRYPKLKLIITVDNGIVAYEGVKEAKKLGIDVIVIDHHQKGEKLPDTNFVIHSTEVCGSALVWFVSREIYKRLVKGNYESKIREKLQLSAIGTVADQLPLLGINRSVVKYGLTELNDTKRPGLLALFKEAGITEAGPYEIGFVIAPRINSMGRLRHGLESLRLLCTKDKVRGIQLAEVIGKVNLERQKVVDSVVEHALSITENKSAKIIVLADEKYHEGVIGLAAARLVEKYYRPAIVISKSKDVSKASARSIPGFNIIETIRKLQEYYLEGGGHPMAAGFSINTGNIDIFREKINLLAQKLLTDDLLQKNLKVDCRLSFSAINYDLLKEISLFEPTGVGNKEPVFFSEKVQLLDVKFVGKDKRHLKLKLKQGEHVFDSIYFGGGEIYSNLAPQMKIDVAYSIEDNSWNGYRNIQLKLKDLHFS
ncbi:MAG: hypothetical protein ACD_13C00157G0015 [uncultured bacterium]|nr:MAG: hypothetical protein ACD_13C00157G0015 [uncultured bacterium]